MLHSGKILLILLATAMLGVAASYGKLYAFHLVLIGAWLAFFIDFYKKNDLQTIQKQSFEGGFGQLFQKIFSILKENKFVAFFGFSLVWFGLHILISDDKKAAIQHWLILFFGSSIVFLYQYFSKKNDALSRKTIQIAGSILGLNMLVCLLEMWGIARYPISDYSVFSDYFGRNVEYYNALKIASANLPLQTAANLLQTTPTGFYWNPNDCAVAVALGFPFFLLKKPNWFTYLGILAVILIATACSARLVLAGLWLMSMASLFFLNIENEKIENGKTKYSKAGIWKNIALAFFLLGASLTNGYSFGAGYWRQLNEVALFAKTEMEKPRIDGDNSKNIRKELISNGLNVIKDNKGIGIGGGNMTSHLYKIGGIGDAKITIMHNFWLELAIEGGVLFALVFAFWYLFLLIKLLQNYFLHQKKIRSLITQDTIINDAIIQPISANALGSGEKSYYTAAIFLNLLGFVVTAVAPGTCIYFLPMYVLFAMAVRFCKYN